MVQYDGLSIVSLEQIPVRIYKNLEVIWDLKLFPKIINGSRIFLVICFSALGAKFFFVLYNSIFYIIFLIKLFSLIQSYCELLLERIFVDLAIVQGAQHVLNLKIDRTQDFLILLLYSLKLVCTISTEIMLVSEEYLQGSEYVLSLVI